ncbi:MAG: L-2-amino-thiazoline-4-carboxylic acid hydrolase [Candidatus Heimdallarchaeota archaeon]
MVTLEEMKQFFFLFAENELIGQYGADQGKILSESFKNRFIKLYSQNEEMMPDALAKEHGVSPIFVIALRQTLKDQQIGQPEFRRMVISIYETLLSGMTSQLKAQLESSPSPFESFVEWSIPGGKRLYDNEYFQQEILQADEKGYHLDIHRCLYFEIFQKNNATALAPVLCDYDLIWARAIEKWARFERKETIVNGDSRCTFRYYPR